MILRLSIHGGLSAGKRAHGAITEDRGVLLEELLSGKNKGGHPKNRSPIPSAAISRARSFLVRQGGFMSMRKRREWGERFRRSGCCRIYATKVICRKRRGPNSDEWAGV